MHVHMYVYIYVRGIRKGCLNLKLLPGLFFSIAVDSVRLLQHVCFFDLLLPESWRSSFSRLSLRVIPLAIPPRCYPSSVTHKANASERMGDFLHEHHRHQ